MSSNNVHSLCVPQRVAQKPGDSHLSRCGSHDKDRSRRLVADRRFAVCGQRESKLVVEADEVASADLHYFAVTHLCRAGSQELRPHDREESSIPGLSVWSCKHGRQARVQDRLPRRQSQMPEAVTHARC